MIGRDLRLVGAGGQPVDPPLLLGLRIVDEDLEQEAVELGLGQAGRSLPARSGSAWRARRTGRAAAWRWPPAVTCRSCIASSRAAWVFGGRAVDLVGEDQVGEDRPGDEPQLAGAGVAVLVEDLGAGDVRGHQVGRELDAVEVQRERLRQAVDHQGLGQAGHPFEDAVAAGEDGDQELVDDLVLADDLPGDLLADLLVGRAQLLQFGEVEVFGRGAQGRVPLSSALEDREIFERQLEDDGGDRRCRRPAPMPSPFHEPSADCMARSWSRVSGK